MRNTSVKTESRSGVMNDAVQTQRKDGLMRDLERLGLVQGIYNAWYERASFENKVALDSGKKVGGLIFMTEPGVWRSRESRPKTQMEIFIGKSSLLPVCDDLLSLRVLINLEGGTFVRRLAAGFNARTGSFAGIKFYHERLDDLCIRFENGQPAINEGWENRWGIKACDEFLKDLGRELGLENQIER